MAFQIWGKLRRIRKKWEIGRSWYCNLLFVVLSVCQQCNLVNNRFNIPSSWKLLAHERFYFFSLRSLHRASLIWIFSTVHQLGGLPYPTHVGWFRFVHLVNLDLFPHKIDCKSTPLSRLWEIHKLTLTLVNVVVGYWKVFSIAHSQHKGRSKKIYDSFSDVKESRVWFSSKNLTPCRMHWNDFLIAQIIAKCHSFPNMYDML